MVKVVGQKYARSSFNKGQITLLDLVYKYRFSSRYLLADSLGVKPGNGLYEKLEVLVKYKYLAKRFEKRLKLQGVPVAYYLTPKGLRALQGLPEHEYITDTVINASYSDKNVSQDFVTHNLNVYKYTNLLKQHYPGLKVFTKREMSQYDYFPSQLPDAFLSLPTDDPQQPKRFFFDLVSDSLPRTALDHRIANYCEFFEEGGWDVSSSELPIMLLLCESVACEKRTLKYVARKLNSLSADEPAYYTSTLWALENATSHEQAIWTSIEDSDDICDLATLSVH